MYEDFWTGPQYGISTGHVGGVVDLALSVGHSIHIDSVKLNPTFAPYALALGRTFVPALGKEVPVHFYWASLDGIGRAPWEPKSVPEFQFINDPAFLR
jgi:hypothetical protein